jgi:Domain of unknown function (DUF4881)
MKRYYWVLGITIWLIPGLIGCGELGKVDQGRVVQFDKGKGMITMIRDKKSDPQNPEYSYLPPLTYILPVDPKETGPDPKIGLRMKMDTKKKQIIIFDPATNQFKTVDYTLVSQLENIAKNDPLVFDENTDTPKSFPVVDRDKKTITLYSKRQKTLTTFTLPKKYFDLPDYTWDAGDEVRIYYKEEGKARRYMNLSKTDIFKK